MSSEALEVLIVVTGAAGGSFVFAAASRAAGGFGKARPQDATNEPLWVRALRPVLDALSVVLRSAKRAPWRTPIDRLLARAGRPFGFDADRVLALAALCHLAAAGAAVSAYDALGLTGLVALGVVGAAAPLVWLAGVGRKRLAAIDRNLAHANDLLVLAIEAGADLVGAVRHWVQRSAQGDPLRAELARLLRDLELGSTRRQALEALATRAPSDVVKGFTASMIQAEQRGTPLAHALRVQSGALRTARSQRIEALAGRASVLVMLPLLLIFGATVLLVFGGVLVRAMRGDLL